MNKTEKVLACLVFVALAIVYGFWYVRNSQIIQQCMDNLPACEEAYYGK